MPVIPAIWPVERIMAQGLSGQKDNLCQNTLRLILEMKVPYSFFITPINPVLQMKKSKCKLPEN
jgi:hypothetical protein